MAKKTELKKLFLEICKKRIESIKTKNQEAELFYGKLLDKFEDDEYAIKEVGLPNIKEYIEKQERLSLYKNIYFCYAAFRELHRAKKQSRTHNPFTLPLYKNELECSIDVCLASILTRLEEKIGRVPEDIFLETNIRIEEKKKQK
jgi:hypothetical protein